MSNLPQQYKDTKSKLEGLKQDILSSSPVKKGTLIKDDKTGVHYRADYISVEDDGDLVISTKEIKNHEINWSSCSNPRYKASKGLNFQVVEWEFDSDKYLELANKAEDTDSISEKEQLLEEMSQMNLDCYHEWVFNSRYDVYECPHCGCETIKSTTQGTFGSREGYSIDL